MISLIRKVVFLYRNGQFYFTIAEMAGGGEPSSVLDLANALGTQLESHEESNALWINADGTADLSWVTPPGFTSQQFHDILVPALEAQYPDVASMPLTVSEWQPTGLRSGTTTTTTTHTTTTTVTT